MKLFNLASMDIINDCLLHFKFSLPSELIQEIKEKFVSKFACCYNYALAIRNWLHLVKIENLLFTYKW